MEITENWHADVLRGYINALAQVGEVALLHHFYVLCGNLVVEIPNFSVWALM